MSSKLAPRFWGAHLVALACVAAAALLGLWQYGAWQSHRESQAVDLTHAPAEPLADVIGPDDPFPGDKVGQPVTVSGTWVPSGTLLVSGREHDGRDGYWVVTPVAVGAADGPALPIVRGWVADRADVPPAPTGAATVEAWLQPPEGTGQVDEDPRDDVLPQLRIADVIQHVDQDLYGAYGVSERPGPGLEQASPEQLPDVGAFTGVRNLLYALEWWFFGGFAVFVWWRWVTETTPEDVPEEQPAGASPAGP